MPVYWLVDLQNDRLEERSQPADEWDYRVTRVLEGADVVVVPGTGEQIAVAELLG